MYLEKGHVLIKAQNLVNAYQEEQSQQSHWKQLSEESHVALTDLL